jgi:aminopeptidase N
MRFFSRVDISTFANLAPFAVIAAIFFIPLTVISEENPASDEIFEAWEKAHLAGAHQMLNNQNRNRSDERIDALHYRLELHPSMENTFLEGRVEFTFMSLEDGLGNILLDLALEMDVISVENVDHFEHFSDVLDLSLAALVDSGEVATVAVNYSGNPTNTGFGSYELDYHNGTAIISTLSEPEGARSWWPSKDDPADKADSVDVLITVPNPWVATSNGVLAAVDTLGADLRYHWQERYPITTYLVCMTVSNFVNFSDYYISADQETLDVVNYVYPEDLADAQEDLNPTVPMLEFFSDTYGEYPFMGEKYGHTEFPWGGAMEHQCNTSYGAVLIRGDHHYDRIVAHELAHQWWGDMITCDTWEDIWLNEGFATYSEALWTEHIGESIVDFMNGRCNVNDPSGPVYDPPSTFSSNTVYRKGAWLLHMLRGITGDEIFFEIMRGWYNSQFKYGSATVFDFMDHCALISGMDLEGFWQGYLFGVDRPSYNWATLYHEHLGNTYAQVLVIQGQQGDLFNMYLPLRFESSLTAVNHVIRDSLQIQGFVLPVPEMTDDAIFDPDDWVLENHMNMNLTEQLSHLICTVIMADGDTAVANEVELLTIRAASPGDYVSAFSRQGGLITTDLKNTLPSWVPGEDLDLHFINHNTADTLIISQSPAADLWIDLGLIQMNPGLEVPELTIAVSAGVFNLAWSAIEGATSYKIYEKSAAYDAGVTLIGETASTSFALPLSTSNRYFLVRAVN